jgi:hypothetical protein
VRLAYKELPGEGRLARSVGTSDNQRARLGHECVALICISFILVLTPEISIEYRECCFPEI